MFIDFWSKLSNVMSACSVTFMFCLRRQRGSDQKFSVPCEAEPVSMFDVFPKGSRNLPLANTLYPYYAQNAKILQKMSNN